MYFGGAMDYEETALLCKDLKFIGRSFNDALNAVNGAVREVKPIRRLAGGSGGNDLGSKLIAAY